MANLLINCRKYENRAFTLVELLIVIGVLATLATVSILVINPAQTLARARDARRLAEMRSLDSALSLAEINNLSLGSGNTVYVSLPDTSPACNNLGLPSLPSGWFYSCQTSANYRKVDSNGWVPVNFGSISFGSPLSILPVDPVNSTSTGNYYTYVTGGSWELTALIESSAKRDMAEKDGGDDGYLFEVGNNLKLSPYLPHGTLLMTKNPAAIKILIVENGNCGQDFPSQLNQLGFTNVITDTSVTTKNQVDVYAPQIVAASQGCWGVSKGALLNQLYDAGYSIYSQGNDTAATIKPISSIVSISTAAGQITPLAIHPINQNWSTTPNSDNDWRGGITAVNQNAIVLAKDNTLGYNEIIYLEETNKGRWLHSQPYPRPNDTLLKNAFFYMAR